MRNAIIFTSVIIFLFFGAIFLTRKGPIEPKDSEAETRLIVNQVGQAISDYNGDCGNLPKETLLLKSLLENVDCKNWKGPYLNRAISDDVWGNSFFYRISSNYADFGSYGKDGKEGGVEESADIVYRIEIR